MTFNAEISTSDELDKNQQQAPSLLRPKKMKNLNKSKDKTSSASNIKGSQQVKSTSSVSDNRIENYLKMRSKSGVNEKEVKELIEDLKQKQNHEMLLVLQEEQESESNRDEAFSKVTNEKERKKLERVFMQERMKARARIDDLAV